jgi:hypothetical protein
MWITGQVVDDRGHARPGVVVEAFGLGMMGRRAAVSNAQSQYVMQDLPPGSYTITFTHSGFATINGSLQTLVTTRSSE